MTGWRGQLGALAAVVVLAAGCGAGGGAGRAPDPASPSGRDGSGNAPGQASAPALDGRVDAAELFTDAELSGALPPPEAFGDDFEAGPDGVRLDWFNGFPAGGNEWADCRPEHGGARYDAYLRELGTYRGASAERSALKWPAGGRRSGDDGAEASVTVALISMTVDRADDYLDIQYRLDEHCPSYGMDMEAGTATVHRSVSRVAGLGDAAILEERETKGGSGDDYDTGVLYTVKARVGGVVLVVGEDPDRDTALARAAVAARRAGERLYGTRTQ
ncbi:hypothetical protein ACFWVU_15485 [Streptomyces sp. NPDC058686]|uniref:hypothetical protein n=1 Tax=Streptomyces sp. NPDC058686 TaxID=3346599 RepID=UPI0036612F58